MIILDCLLVWYPGVAYDKGKFLWVGVSIISQQEGKGKWVSIPSIICGEESRSQDRTLKLGRNKARHCRAWRRLGCLTGSSQQVDQSRGLPILETEEAIFWKPTCPGCELSTTKHLHLMSKEQECFLASYNEIWYTGFLPKWCSSFIWPSFNCISESMNSFSVCGMSAMCLAQAKTPWETTKDIEGPGPVLWETGLTPLSLFNATTGSAKCNVL